jgi:hypothetical protein
MGSSLLASEFELETQSATFNEGRDQSGPFFVFWTMSE